MVEAFKRWQMFQFQWPVEKEITHSRGLDADRLVLKYCKVMQQLCMNYVVAELNILIRIQIADSVTSPRNE